MSKNQYVSRIQSELNKPYEVYSLLFIEYIGYLNMIIAENPNNTTAVNQLAIALLEARNYDSAFQTLKNDVYRNPTIQSLNNLAYFYLYEEGNTEKAIEALMTVVHMDPISPVPYNILGEAYIRSDKPNDALLPLSKAVEIEGRAEYLNNYAVALFMTGNVPKASDFFLKASKNWFTDYDSHRPYYHFGVCQGLLGNYTKALEVAANLIKLDFENIGVHEIADIYYLCGEYECVVKMYKSTNLWYSLDWVSIYLYSLYKLAQAEEMEIVLSKAITQCTEMINDLVPDDFKNPEELIERKSEINIEINNYKKIYLDITQNNFTPQFNFVPSTLFACGLLGCIRHNIPNYLNSLDDI